MTDDPITGTGGTERCDGRDQRGPPAADVTLTGVLPACRRRAIVDALLQSDGGAAAFSDVLTATSADEDPAERFAVHAYLVGLDQAARIDYDHRTGAVRVQPGLRDLRDELDGERVDLLPAERADWVRPNATASDGYGLLVNPRTRHAVAALVRHDGSLSLPDMADLVSEREAGVSLSEVPSDRVRDVYLSLYHSHLPKLSGAGIVAYDQERDWVTALPPADHLAPLC